MTSRSHVYLPSLFCCRLIIIILNPNLSSSLSILSFYNSSTSLLISESILWTSTLVWTAPDRVITLRELFFFLINKTCIAIGDFNSLIWPVQRFSVIKASSSICFTDNKKYILDILDSTPEINSIVWSYL